MFVAVGASNLLVYFCFNFFLKGSRFNFFNKRSFGHAVSEI